MYDIVIPVPSVTLPVVLISVVLPVSVPVKPVQSNPAQVATDVTTVTVTEPDPESKYTSSIELGSASPPLPPLVNDHLEPAVPFQLPVPPTQ